MAKNVKVNEDFSLRYNCREDASGDTVMDMNVDFTNPKDPSVIADRLNTWLTAIGLELQVSTKTYVGTSK